MKENERLRGEMAKADECVREFVLDKERLQRLYDVAVADRVRMHETIKRLRAELSKTENPKIGD